MNAYILTYSTKDKDYFIKFSAIDDKASVDIAKKTYDQFVDKFKLITYSLSAISKDIPMPVTFWEHENRYKK